MIPSSYSVRPGPDFSWAAPLDLDLAYRWASHSPRGDGAAAGFIGIDMTCSWAVRTGAALGPIAAPTYILTMASKVLAGLAAQKRMNGSDAVMLSVTRLAAVVRAWKSMAATAVTRAGTASSVAAGLQGPWADSYRLLNGQ